MKPKSVRSAGTQTSRLRGKQSQEIEPPHQTVFRHDPLARRPLLALTAAILALLLAILAVVLLRSGSALAGMLTLVAALAGR